MISDAAMPTPDAAPQEPVGPMDAVLARIEGAQFRSDLRAVSGANLGRLALENNLSVAEINAIAAATRAKKRALTASPESTRPPEIPGIDFDVPEPDEPAWSPSDIYKDLPVDRPLDARERQVPKGDR